MDSLPIVPAVALALLGAGTALRVERMRGQNERHRQQFELHQRRLENTYRDLLELVHSWQVWAANTYPVIRIGSGPDIAETDLDEKAWLAMATAVDLFASDEVREQFKDHVRTTAIRFTGNVGELHEIRTQGTDWRDDESGRFRSGLLYQELDRDRDAMRNAVTDLETAIRGELLTIAPDRPRRRNCPGPQRRTRPSLGALTARRLRLG